MLDVRRFLRLPANDKLLYLQAWLLLPVISVALRALGFRRVMSYLKKRLPAQGSTRNEDKPRAHRVAHLVEAAARRGFGNRNCLRRSVTLWYLLGRANLRAELRIGVSTPASDHLDAHAWVEFAGEALNDRSNPGAQFTPIQDLSSSIEAL